MFFLDISYYEDYTSNTNDFVFMYPAIRLEQKKDVENILKMILVILLFNQLNK